MLQPYSPLYSFFRSLSNSSFVNALRNLIKSHGILLLLFLCSMYTIIIPSIHVYIDDAFAIMTLLLLFIPYQRVRNNKSFIFFSIIYFAFLLVLGGEKSNFEALGYLVCPLAYYLFGYSIIDKSKSKVEFPLFLIILIITSSLLFWTRSINDIATNGLINISRAIVNEHGVLDTSATLLGLVASLGIASIAYVASPLNKHNLLLTLFLLAFILSILSIIHLINRTGLVVGLMTLIITILYTRKLKPKTIILILAIAAGVYYLIVSNSAFYIEAMDAYQMREEGNESVTTGNGRFDKWILSCQYLFQYPFGWNMELTGYCHNLWLDVARSTGVISFILLLIVSVKNYCISFKLYRIKGDSINGILVGINLCIFLTAFVEPVLDGLPTFFYLMCLIWGIQMAHYNKINTLS